MVGSLNFVLCSLCAPEHAVSNKELSTKFQTLLLFQFNLSKQLIDSVALLFDAIAYEVKLGRARQIQREAKLLANVRRRMFQSIQRLLVFGFITGHCDVNARGALVGGEANVSYGYRCHPRVIEFVANDLSNLLP